MMLQPDGQLSLWGGSRLKGFHHTHRRHLFWAFPHMFCFEFSSSSIFYLRLYCWVELSWSSFYLPTKILVAMMNHEGLNYKIG